MTGTIQKKAAEKPAGKAPNVLGAYINRMSGEIKKALPAVMTPERFSRIALSAVSSNPKLQECTPQSFLAAMMTAAQLGMEVNTPLGHAYLIPFRNHGTMECQFQLGYKGLLDLVYRSGDVSTVQAQVVYENDDFEYSFGLEPTLRHVPARTDRGAATHVYAVFRTKDGGYGFEVMSMEDVRAHARKYSKSFGDGPWQTNFEEMAKKTVLKRCLKYAPMKTEFFRGLSRDETISTEIAADMTEVVAEYPEEEPEVVAETAGDPGTGEVQEVIADA